jgi:VWFA-related protein
VSDGGTRQQVRVEESADAPLDLVVVAQPIPSIAFTSAEQASRLAAGVTALLDQVQDRDRLGALAAGAPPTRIRALEVGRPTFNVAAFGQGQSAALFDALSAGLGEFVETDRRRALIAFTNAVDSRSTTSFEALTEMARRLGPAFVIIGSPIMIRDQVSVVAQTTGGKQIGVPEVGIVRMSVFPEGLQSLARRTGGMTVDLGTGAPATIIAEMLTQLRTTYLISYSPPPGKGWHPVSVKVNRRGAKVTAREGYFVD